MLGLSPRAWEHLQTLYQLGDPRQMQRRVLADMRALMADYVRSPAFLSLMRWNLNAMTSSPLASTLTSPSRSR
jgi:hypothetical protein